MAKGKTISITLPPKVVEFYEDKAKELGTSRSSIIGNIIMVDYDLKKSQEKVSNVSTGNTSSKESE